VRVLTDRPAWYEFAACKGMDPALFYPDHRPTTVAQGICFACPAQVACLEHSLEHGEIDGVWGGLGVKARRKIRKERRTESAGDIRKCCVCLAPFVMVTLRHVYCCRRCEVRGRNRRNWVKESDYLIALPIHRDSEPMSKEALLAAEGAG